MHLQWLNLHLTCKLSITFKRVLLTHVILDICRPSWGSFYQNSRCCQWMPLVKINCRSLIANLTEQNKCHSHALTVWQIASMTLIKRNYKKLQFLEKDALAFNSHTYWSFLLNSSIPHSFIYILLRILTYCISSGSGWGRGTYPPPPHLFCFYGLLCMK